MIPAVTVFSLVYFSTFFSFGRNPVASALIAASAAFCAYGYYS
jgi:hypothetical protein